jgi:hypothetical protein
MDAAMAQVEQAFGSTTLAEVLGESSRIKPLCDDDGRRKPRRRAASRR